VIEPRNKPGGFPQLNIVPVNELLSRLYRSEIACVIARKLRDLLIAVAVDTEDISTIVTHRSVPGSGI